MTTARRQIAIVLLVISVLQHDVVRGQGGFESELQRKSGKLDMSAWLQANGGKVRQ